MQQIVLSYSSLFFNNEVNPIHGTGMVGYQLHIITESVQYSANVDD